MPRTRRPNFLPTPGTIVEYREPGGFGVRVDSGYGPGPRSASTTTTSSPSSSCGAATERGDRALAPRSRRVHPHRYRHHDPIPPAGPRHAGVRRRHPPHAHRRGRHGPDALTQPGQPQLPEDEELAERQMTVEVGGRRFVVRLWSPEIPCRQSPGDARHRGAALRSSPLGHPAPTAKGGHRPDAGHHRQGLPRRPGDRVIAGTPLFILEAMKMENEVKAPDRRRDRRPASDQPGDKGVGWRGPGHWRPCRGCPPRRPSARHRAGACSAPSSTAPGPP
jgi:acetyl-CoA/propionyl-CoA carboxylase, biotin carboxylase, biotin carboxyl carrier protein